MPRVKTGVVRRRRHKKVLKLARGFFGGRRKHFRKAKEQLDLHIVSQALEVLKKHKNMGARVMYHQLEIEN